MTENSFNFLFKKYFGIFFVLLFLFHQDLMAENNKNSNNFIDELDSSGNKAEVKKQPKEVKKWILNQKNTDIREFIAQIANITGETMIVDPKVKSDHVVSVISSQPLTKDEVYDVFLEVLLANGYSVIPKGDTITVSPINSVKTNLSVTSTKKIAGIITTKVMPVQSISAMELMTIVRPLVAQYGHVSASVSSNAIIVTDIESNLDRIEQLVNELDNAGDKNYEIIQLHHAWVGDVAKIIQETLSSSRHQTVNTLQVISNERSNQLILKGHPTRCAKIKNLVITLDQEGTSQSTTRVVFLHFADAKHLSGILSDAAISIQNSQVDKSWNNQAPMPVPFMNNTNANPWNKNDSNKKGSSNSVFVKADETQNAIVLIADSNTLTKMEHIIKQLDIPRSQVLLEGAVVEISGDVSDAIGIQWGIDGRKTQLTEKDKPKNTLTPHILADAQISLGSIALRDSNFGVLINALSKNTKNNILSTPSILTLDNREAELTVGKNFPIKTGSYQTASGGSSTNPFTTTERKDIGIKLKITPHINENNTIKLELEQEVSTLDSDASVAVNLKGDLVFNNRKLKTTVLVENGQTIVIGGLMEDMVGKSSSRVPLLSNIPILGNLFKNRDTVNKKRNLMLFVRPTVMNNIEDSNRVTRDKFSNLKLLKGNKNAPLKGEIRTIDTLFDHVISK